MSKCQKWPLEAAIFDTFDIFGFLFFMLARAATLAGLARQAWLPSWPYLETDSGWAGQAGRAGRARPGPARPLSVSRTAN